MPWTKYAAAHKKHGRGPDKGQRLHQPRRARKNGAAQAALHPRKNRFAAAPAEVQPAVVEFDDGRDEAVNAHRHDGGDGGQHQHPGSERGVRDRPQCNDDDLGREYEIGAHSALDLLLLDRDEVGFGVGERIISSASCAESSALL